MDLSMNVNKLIHNLEEFCSNFKELSQPTYFDIKKYMLDQCVPYKVWVTLENPDCLEKIAKANESGANIAPRIRIILSTIRDKANFGIPLVRECNGVVMELVQEPSGIRANIMVYPPRDFNPNYQFKHIEQFIQDGEYVIQPIYDGTTCNIYYDPRYLNMSASLEGTDITTSYTLGKWCFSTKKSFDISHIEWRGAVYEEIITDVLSIYPEFCLDRLDKNTVYTVGFKHPAHHPFRQPGIWNIAEPSTNANVPWIKRMWLISPFSEDVSSQCGIPLQSSFDLSEIKPGRSYTGTFKSHCEFALNNYLKVQEGGDIFMGYILRSKNEARTGRFSDILMESSLFREIKRCVYDRPPTNLSEVRETLKQNFKNFNYVIMLSWLDFTKRTLFFTLFPQFKSYADNFREIFTETACYIHDESHKSRSDYADKAQKLANRMSPLIFKRFIPARSPNAKHRGKPWQRGSNTGANEKITIYNLLTNVGYADIYLHELF